MKTLRTVGILGIGSCLGLMGCGSSKDGGANNDGQGGGYNPGGNGSITNGTPAQDTANGTAPITADVATQLTNPADTSKCTGGGAEPEGGAPPVFEFVIDASGSMKDDPANPTTDPNGPSKWDVFAETMPGVFAALPANFAIGVTYYNRPSGCYTGRQAVPIAPHTAAQQALIETSIANTNPNGYTPTYNAWKFGLTTLTSWQAPAAYATSPRYIVLITDGIPTVNQNGCTVASGNGSSFISQTEYESQIGLIANDPLAANVRSFFVGVVGSENPQGAPYDPLFMLSNLAKAGHTETPPGCVPASGTPSGNTVNPRGTYCHFDLSQATDFGAALSSTLGGIAQSVISCDYTVPTPTGQTIDPSNAALVYNDGTGNYSVVLPNTTPGITAADCDKGYIFTDAASTQLHICATTCAALQANPAATLQFRFGCKGVSLVN